MTYALLALIAYVALREYLSAREREAWSKERATLLNRIQAPEKVINESFAPSNLKQFTDHDDDAQFWKAKADGQS